MRISSRGSDGYALLDTLLALLLAALMAAEILPGLAAAARFSGKSLDRARGLIDSLSEGAAILMEENHGR